jgi:hypothetical protein
VALDQGAGTLREATERAGPMLESATDPRAGGGFDAIAEDVTAYAPVVAVPRDDAGPRETRPTIQQTIVKTPESLRAAALSPANADARRHWRIVNPHPSSLAGPIGPRAGLDGAARDPMPQPLLGCASCASPVAR